NEGKPVNVPVVNLLVTPEQAEILSLASNGMRIQLVLRNPIDNATAKTQGSEMASLFGAPAPKPAAPRAPVVHKPAPAPAPLPVPVLPVVAPKPSPFVVQVMNGGKRTEQTFELQGDRR